MPALNCTIRLAGSRPRSLTLALGPWPLARSRTFVELTRQGFACGPAFMGGWFRGAQADLPLLGRGSRTRSASLPPRMKANRIEAQIRTDGRGLEPHRWAAQERKARSRGIVMLEPARAS